MEEQHIRPSLCRISRLAAYGDVSTGRKVDCRAGGMQRNNAEATQDQLEEELHASRSLYHSHQLHETQTRLQIKLSTAVQLVHDPPYLLAHTDFMRSHFCSSNAMLQSQQ